MAISITARRSRSCHPACTGSPSGPVTSVVRLAPPSTSSVPSPPSASGTSSQSQPHASRRPRDGRRDVGGARGPAELVGGGDDSPRPAIAVSLARCHADRPVVIVSNRGPVSFQRDDDRLVARRGAGGLVTGSGPDRGRHRRDLARRRAVRRRPRGGGARASPRPTGCACGSSTSTRRRTGWRTTSCATRRCGSACTGCSTSPGGRASTTAGARRGTRTATMNDAFADAAAELAPEGAAVLVQDYHLALVGPRLRALRPDLRTVHFSHTPWCDPDGLRPLPDDVAASSSAASPGTTPARSTPAAGRRRSRRRAARCSAPRRSRRSRCPRWRPIPTTSPSPARRPSAPPPAAALREAVGDRKLLVRVDRIELSKNVLRGFHAFDDLLERHPEWRERVVFAAFLYPSREGLAEYLAYRQEVEGLVARLNEKWATPDWTPIPCKTSDDFPRSVAALQLADVVLVNPIRDGLNLVAMEGVLVSEHDERARAVHRGRRVGAARRRRRDRHQPVRRRRHRRRAAHRAEHDRRRTRRPARRGCAPSSRRARRATGCANSSRPPAERLEQLCRRSRAPSGPSTTRSAASSSSSGASSLRTATRTVATPSAASVRARRTPAGRRRRRRGSTPRRDPSARSRTRGALVRRDRRMQLERHARRSNRQPRTRRLPFGQLTHRRLELGVPAVVQRQRQALALDAHVGWARSPAPPWRRRR